MSTLPTLAPISIVLRRENYVFLESGSSGTHVLLTLSVVGLALDFRSSFNLLSRIYLDVLLLWIVGVLKKVSLLSNFDSD